MTLQLQVSLILGILLYFAIIIYLLRKRKLLLKYTLLWILTGIIMLILVIFPKIMDYVIRLIGIKDLTNGLFMIAIFFVIIILMSITSIASNLRVQNKAMVQKVALIEKRLREIEQSEVK